MICIVMRPLRAQLVEKRWKGIIPLGHTTRTILIKSKFRALEELVSYDDHVKERSTAKTRRKGCVDSLYT